MIVSFLKYRCIVIPSIGCHRFHKIVQIHYKTNGTQNGTQMAPKMAPQQFTNRL